MRMFSAREDERRRLARDLHDTVGQRLIAARLRLEAARLTADSDDLDLLDRGLNDLGTHLQDLIQEVRDISRGLYPPALEQLGLCPALKQLAGSWEGATAVVGVRCSPAARKARFSQTVEIAFYRIAQEAVSNAVRHARCRQVQIRVGYARGKLTLSITDDGRGFKPDQAIGKGLGLISMRERAESAGAALEISSRPGRSRVEVQATCPRNEGA